LDAETSRAVSKREIGGAGHPGGIEMACRLLTGSFLLLSFPVLLCAAEPSWEGKTVILTRSGVKLQPPESKDIAPKTSGVAKDLMFQARKEEKDRLLIDSRRQQGWIAKSDVVTFDQAIDHFTKVLAGNPKNSHALTARGLVLSTRNVGDKALADFNSAIELDPKATLAYYYRANLEYGKGQYDKALADFNAVIQNDPEFDWAYHVRGWIHYRRMDYDKALADYETAIKLVPTETVFYRDRGNVAFIRKKYDDALTDYSKSIEMDPTYIVPRQLRGKTWEAKKEYAKALADYEKAAQLAPKGQFGASYLTTLAMLLASCPDAKIRDGKKALEVAQKAYELAKGPNELATLATAYAELGEFDKAVEWQTKAIDSAPSVLKEQYQARLKLYQDKKPYRSE
jgi:tetratricopeptide (TPR) repeat protein